VPRPADEKGNKPACPGRPARPLRLIPRALPRCQACRPRPSAPARTRLGYDSAVTVRLTVAPRLRAITLVKVSDLVCVSGSASGISLLFREGPASRSGAHGRHVAQLSPEPHLLALLGDEGLDRQLEVVPLRSDLLCDA
jgi:hypothetical protein